MSRLIAPYNSIVGGTQCASSLDNSIAYWGYTTMLNVPAQGIAQSHAVSVPVLRPGARLFWVLASAICIAVMSIMLVIITTLPARVPVASSADVMAVREAVLLRLNGTVNDPLVELGAGVTARASNVRGLSLGGRTYYYSISGQPNFDPLSRGVVAPTDVEVLLRDNGPQAFVIYTLLRPAI